VSLLQPSQEVRELLLEGANVDTDQKLKGVVTKSFDKLTPVAQSIFLDVVCVMHGTRWCNVALALDIWCSWHRDGVHLAWRELLQHSLITVDASVFHVHDVIKALGRGIIQQGRHDYYGSRMWVRHDGQVVEFQVCGREMQGVRVERRLFRSKHGAGVECGRVTEGQRRCM
jgi:hypothetical protein